ncbi:dihydroneopterin aldolase [Massilia sp. LXY-6]|uniref:dihydroneopterin aldolase n=1 Tax=Massilia sp. LXY-6 TaxID=3379823 RepID=UPI003EE351FD
MNQIFIDDIRTLAQIGIYPHELTGSQMVSISLRLGIGGQAAHSDRIEDTIDYAVLVERLRAVLAQRRFGLLEHLAEYLARLIFDEFCPLWLTLTLHKPDVLQGVGRVGIQISRTFEQHIAGAASKVSPDRLTPVPFELAATGK